MTQTAATPTDFRDVCRMARSQRSPDIHAEIQAEVDKLLVAVHRHKAPDGECVYCDRERAANNNFHPSHDASERCESGKRDHCSCDTCF